MAFVCKGFVMFGELCKMSLHFNDSEVAGLVLK